MSERENTEKRDEEAKETNTRTESTSMEETKGQDTGLRTSESYGRTDRRRRERDPRSSREKRENATQMRYDLGQSSEYPVRPGVADCQHYLNGHCFFGRSCRFNHPPFQNFLMGLLSLKHIPQRNQMGLDTVQVRPQLPESSQMRHEMMQPSPNPGARDCRQYLQNGKCSYGAKCRFNHPPAPVLPDRVSLGAIDCKQYLQTGQCRYGLKCRYNHPPAPVLPQWVSRQICKFFQKGNCKNGSGCKFTHSMSGDGSEHQVVVTSQPNATAWGKKRRGENSSTRPWKRVRQQAHGPSVPSGEGGIQTEQRLEIPENRNVNAQENLQEQADMERQNREAEEKAQEERRQQIENARREARLRLERMRPRALTSSVDQLREALPDIGIDRKEGDGF
ncbi:hypothetical protein Bca4012_056304 [Brassica carinata]